MIDNKPLVSVIMNCYNGEEFLQEAIDSVYAQSYQNWEIVFWDNKSVDNSANIARSYDDKLKYFCGEINIPLYEARNYAIEQCSGECIAFLDCDDVWLETKLEKQVDMLQSGAQIVYSWFDIINSHGEICEPGPRINNSSKLTNSLLIKNYISIGSVLINSGLLKSKRFDFNYFLMGDHELWIRLSTENKFFCMPEVLELSRRHGSNASKMLRHKWIVEQRYFYRSFMGKYFLKYPYIIFFILKSELRNIVMKLGK